MENLGLIKLRKKWFQLKAKEFIARYASGFMVLALILPGVAVGDNLSLILKAITKPFLIVSSINESALMQLCWLAVVMVVFVVWARAQKIAITGGDFSIFMRSLPIKEKLKHINNIKMILNANHFLWLFIIAGFYFLIKSPTSLNVEYVRYICLMLFLFYAQYVFVFALNKKNVLLSLIFAIGLIFPVPSSFEFLRHFLLIIIFVYMVSQLFVIGYKSHQVIKQNKLLGIPSNIKESIYIQMLFKSGLSSTLFRIALVLFFIIGFFIAANHFSKLNEDNLDPYAFILEAILAFYLSGFYLLYVDERKPLKDVMITLPLKKLFWPLKDILATFILSALIHLLVFAWEINYFTISLLLTSWLFHFLLLLLCFPLRTMIKNEQTFITFAVVLIITIITIYNLS